MQPLPLANMDLMWEEDITAGLKSGRLELIASRHIVRRGVFSDAQIAVTKAVIMQGVKYMAQVLSFYETYSEDTWYGQRSEARVSFYRRKNVPAEEPILRARVLGEV